MLVYCISACPLIFSLPSYCLVQKYLCISVFNLPGFLWQRLFCLMCSFNCVLSLLLISVKVLRCVACFFVRTLFHCFVCALVADPRIGRTLVVSFDILRRLRLVTALSLRSYKTNVSGCGGLIAFLPIIKRLIPLTESHLVGVIIFNSIQLSVLLTCTSIT